MAHKSSTPFVQGQVVEAGTNKPIAGAIVVGTWQATFSAVVDSHTDCVHVEAAITDEQGRYQLPAWEGYEPSWLVESYKPGYIRSQEYYAPKHMQYVGSKTDRNIDLLEPFKGTSQERLQYLKESARRASCLGGGFSRRNSYPYEEALYAESHQLQMPAEDLRWLRIIAAGDATAVDGWPTGAEADQREEQFLKDHLPLPDYAAVTAQPLTIVQVPPVPRVENAAPLAAAKLVQVPSQDDSPSSPKAAP